MTRSCRISHRGPPSRAHHDPDRSSRIGARGAVRVSWTRWLSGAQVPPAPRCWPLGAGIHSTCAGSQRRKSSERLTTSLHGR